MGVATFSTPCQIHAATELEDVFLHFLKRFEALPNPKSVAEARISADEFQALTSWFLARWGFPRMWSESTWQDDLGNGASASRQEMFGALLLIFASEICRDKSNEDSVWPAVTAVLKADKISFPALFVGGQPTTVCKNAMAAGARRINLRNLIDRYGTQEYFDTLKLQFGFTLRGATPRLPEWLDGFEPIAVKILAGGEREYGDLRSNSFADLWKTLKDFRRNRVSEEDTSTILHASPWIRPQWAAELLQAARLRPNRTSSATISTEAIDSSIEPVCELALHWKYPAKPQLVLRLNEEQIIQKFGESDSATFAIDGRVVDRWLAQEGGGAPIDPASRLDPRRDCALICDTDLNIPDAVPDFMTKDRSAYRLVGPWRRDLQVVCAGIMYWQPKIDEKEQFQPIRLTIESPPGEVAEIGSSSPVQVVGVPSGVTDVSLIGENSRHSLIHRGGMWQTEQPVRITLGMALGEERVRVRVTSNDYSRIVTPTLSLNLRGIACVETDSNIDSEPQWKLLNLDRPMNRADGSGKARIFATTGSQLYEGPRLVGKLNSRTLPLRDLHGWGDPLVVRVASQSQSTMIGSV